MSVHPPLYDRTSLPPGMTWLNTWHYQFATPHTDWWPYTLPLSHAKILTYLPTMFLSPLPSGSLSFLRSCAHTHSLCPSLSNYYLYIWIPIPLPEITVSIELTAESLAATVFSIDWFWDPIFRTNWNVRDVNKLSWDLQIVLGPHW